jgi:hypothetical protein
VSYRNASGRPWVWKYTVGLSLHFHPCIPFIFCFAFPFVLLCIALTISAHRTTTPCVTRHSTVS